MSQQLVPVKRGGQSLVRTSESKVLKIMSPDMYEAMVTIIVQGDRRLYTHPACLAKAPELANVLERSPNDQIDLSTVEADPIKQVIWFLNNNQVIQVYQKAGPKQIAQLELLVKTYFLAFDFKIERLQNQLIDELMTFSLENFFHLPCLQLLGRTVPNGTSMLRYLIAQLAYDMKTCNVSRIKGLEGWATAGGYPVQRVFSLLAGDT